MRVIFILILVTVGLALLRMLVNDVIRAASKAMRGSPRAEKPKAEPGGKAERLVRDPVSGSYIVEEAALKAEIDGRTYFFESAKTRESFLRGKAKS